MQFFVAFVAAIFLARATTPDRKCKRDAISVRFQGDLWPIFKAARIMELETVLKHILPVNFSSSSKLAFKLSLIASIAAAQQ